MALTPLVPSSGTIGLPQVDCVEAACTRPVAPIVALIESNYRIRQIEDFQIPPSNSRESRRHPNRELK